MKKRKIIVIDEALWKELRIKAIEKGKNLSQYIEELLREAIRE